MTDRDQRTYLVDELRRRILDRERLEMAMQQATGGMIDRNVSDLTMLMRVVLILAETPESSR